jgi:hypothetical protein
MGINTARRLLLSASCLLAVLAILAAGHKAEARRAGVGFAAVSGTRFMVDGRPFYSHGFNAHWLMYMASNPDDRGKVIDTLDQASRLGATLVRTWAFATAAAAGRCRSPPACTTKTRLRYYCSWNFMDFRTATYNCYTLLDSIGIASTNCVPTDSQNFLKYVLEFLKT